MSKPSLQAQALAVERAFVNRRDFAAGLRSLVLKGKRPADELARVEQHLHDLGPAVATMKWLALNEEVIRAAVEGGE